MHASAGHGFAQLEQLEPRAPLTTFTVTSPGDAIDPGDGVITLREAIIDANDNSGPDTIEFLLPGSGVRTISPTSPLPTITDAVTIDGTSVAGYSGMPLIELDGSSSGVASGLVIEADDTTVLALAINRFDQFGVLISAADRVVVEASYIGTDATGQSDLGNNRHGIYLVNSNNCRIGGSFAGGGNVISGNGDAGNVADGIRVDGGGGHLFYGNRIGTDADGDTAIGNSNDGMHIRLGSTSNTIGGTTSGHRNIISGNVFDGIEINGQTTTGNRVLGNYLGTDASGLNSVANGDGIELDNTAGNAIGSIDPGGGNLISGNSGDGIELFNGSTLNTIVSNRIGTDVTGLVALPNVRNGILALSGSNANTIGGVTALARNVIAGNLSDGIELSGVGTNANVVIGNYLGTAADGNTAIGNGNDGVYVLSGAADNVIGGTTPGSGNLISGNAFDGVEINGNTTTNNRITGNWIGTDASGLVAIPNGSDGIELEAAIGNFIGGNTPAAGNVISGNASDGIECA